MVLFGRMVLVRKIWELLRKSLEEGFREGGGEGVIVVVYTKGYFLLGVGFVNVIKYIFLFLKSCVFYVLKCI